MIKRRGQNGADSRFLATQAPVGHEFSHFVQQGSVQDKMLSGRLVEIGQLVTLSRFLALDLVTRRLVSSEVGPFQVVRDAGFFEGLIESTLLPHDCGKGMRNSVGDERGDGRCL